MRTGRSRAAPLAVGACSAAAQRLPALEAALAGRVLAPGIGAVVSPVHLAPLAPITDVRASAAYRGDAAATLVARALEKLAYEQSVDVATVAFTLNGAPQRVAARPAERLSDVLRETLG